MIKSIPKVRADINKNLANGKYKKYSSDIAIYILNIIHS